MAHASPQDYVELRARSAFSFLEACSNPEDLVEAAAALDMPALALADRDGVSGLPRFHRAAKASGLRPLVGAEIAVGPLEAPEGRSDGSRDPSLRPAPTDRLRLLVETTEGWRR